MRKNISISIASLLLLGASSVSAAEWIEVASTDAGSLFHMNLDRFKYVNGESVDAWVKVTYKPGSAAQKEAKSENYVLHEYKFNCSQRVFGLSSFHSYAKNGSVLSSKNYLYPPMKPVVPESAGEELLDTACMVHAAMVKNGGKLGKPSQAE